MTEQEIIALKYYVSTMERAKERLQELTKRPRRTSDLRLVGNPAVIQEEMAMRHEELELRSNIDVVFAIRMEILLDRYRGALVDHGIDIPELPLAFEQMKVDEEGNVIEEDGDDKDDDPPSSIILN